MRETIYSSHLYRKRGVFYFSRRVPADLRQHYKSGRIVLSLRTKSAKVAEARAATLAANLDQDWLTLRWKDGENAFSRFIADPAETDQINSDAPKLTEAAELYLSAKGATRPKTFHQTVNRAVRELAGRAGDKPIDTYTRIEANALRDDLFERGLAKASVKRVFSVLRALSNFSTRELGLAEVQTFSTIYLGENDEHTERKRKPIPIETIWAVQSECRQIDDEARWLVALISDTGMRLSEAAGLVKSDLALKGKHPHVIVQTHPWRGLKTQSSSRLVPLVGEALWAAARASDSANSEFLFPKYCGPNGCKSNSASAALNKWLKQRVPDGCVIHSFRHSMRDRLRAEECPPDIIDRLGGWTVGGVGEGYGEGYPLEVLDRWMSEVDLKNDQPDDSYSPKS